MQKTSICCNAGRELNEPIKNSAAAEIGDWASELARRYQDVAERVNLKLRPIREYPPYFALLRENLQKLERTIECITHTLDEVDL